RSPTLSLRWFRERRRGYKASFRKVSSRRRRGEQASSGLLLGDGSRPGVVRSPADERENRREPVVRTGVNQVSPQPEATKWPVRSLPEQRLVSLRTSCQLPVL